MFVGVVEAGSFTAAAERLGHSVSFVSKEIARLEARIGARLLNRTTRTQSLTDAGRDYYERCRQIVADAEEAEDRVSLGRERTRGLLRVSAPVSLGLGRLASVLPDFLETHPEMRAEIDLNDRMVDMMADGFDVVIRVGQLKASSLICRRIASSRGVIVAAPDYRDRRGRPAHTSELSGQACISYSLMRSPERWDFVEPDGRRVSVDIRTRVLCNSAELETALAVAGLGVTRLPAFACARELAEGRLQSVLDDYGRSEIGVYAIYPERRHLPAKTRVFIDFLIERFGD